MNINITLVSACFMNSAYISCAFVVCSIIFDLSLVLTPSFLHVRITTTRLIQPRTTSPHHPYTHSCTPVPHPRIPSCAHHTPINTLCTFPVLCWPWINLLIYSVCSFFVIAHYLSLQLHLSFLIYFIPLTLITLLCSLHSLFSHHAPSAHSISKSTHS